VYGNHHMPAGVAAAGTFALTSGWMITGWTLLGLAIAATTLTVVRLRRRPGSLGDRGARAK